MPALSCANGSGAVTSWLIKQFAQDLKTYDVFVQCLAYKVAGAPRPEQETSGRPIVRVHPLPESAEPVT